MLIVIVEGMRIPKGEWRRRFQMDLVPMDLGVLSFPSTFHNNDWSEFFINIEEF